MWKQACVPAWVLVSCTPQTADIASKVAQTGETRPAIGTRALHSPESPACIALTYMPAHRASAEFAAGELRAYLERITGTAGIVNEAFAARPEDPSAQTYPVQIDIGPRMCASASTRRSTPNRPSANAPHPLLSAQHGKEAFALDVHTSRATIVGNSGRAILYGVYALLEHLGVRFFAPRFAFYEDLAEYVPRQRMLAPSPLRRLEQPSFSLRRKYVEEGWSYTAQNMVQLVDWMAKSRLNTLVVPFDYRMRGVTRWDDFREIVTPELKKRGMWLEVGGHGYNSFLPPRADQPANWKDGSANVFRVSNGPAVKAYISRVVAYLKSRPEIDIFDAWPPDNATWGRRTLRRFGSPSDAQSHIANELVRAFRNENLDVRVEVVGYRPTVDPPERIALDPSVIVDIAPYDRSQSESLVNPRHPKNKRYAALIRRWRAARFQGLVGVYAYYRRYSFRSLPLLLLQQIGSEIPYHHREGAQGLGMYAEPADWIVFEPVHWLVARLSWNVRDKEALSTYLRERYGNAANHVARYFDYAEQAARALCSVPGGAYDELPRVEAALEAFQAAQNSLRDARASRNRSSKLRDQLIDHLDYALSDTQMSLADVRGERAQREHNRRKVHRYVERHYRSGLLLRDYRVLKRIDPSVTKKDIPKIIGAYR